MWCIKMIIIVVTDDPTDVSDYSNSCCRLYDTFHPARRGAVCRCGVSRWPRWWCVPLRMPTISTGSPCLRRYESPAAWIPCRSTRPRCPSSDRPPQSPASSAGRRCNKRRIDKQVWRRPSDSRTDMYTLAESDRQYGVIHQLVVALQSRSFAVNLYFSNDGYSKQTDSRTDTTPLLYRFLLQTHTAY